MVIKRTVTVQTARVSALSESNDDYVFPSTEFGYPNSLVRG